MAYSRVYATLISDLNFIANVPPGQKLFVGPPQSYSDPKDVVSWTMRKLGGQTAQTTALFVRETCERVVQELRNYAGTTQHAKLRAKMTEAVQGIQRLIVVYQRYPLITSHLNDSIDMLRMDDERKDDVPCYPV